MIENSIFIEKIENRRFNWIAIDKRVEVNIEPLKNRCKGKGKCKCKWI